MSAIGDRIELGRLILTLDPPQLHDRAGNAVRLRRQALDVLAFLAARAGNLVSKQALLDSVWADVVVTDDSVVQCIAEIRQVLGDDSHRIITTEHKRGYRLVVPPPADFPKLAPAANALRPDQSEFSQQIQFANSADGIRIAMAVAGSGPALIRMPHWMTHIAWDWQSAVLGPRIQGLAAALKLIRYDGRGTGMSDQSANCGTLEDWQCDLDAVVDAAGVERFGLLGVSGGAFTAIRYAVRHPKRVSCLILLSAAARGDVHRGVPVEHVAAFSRILHDGWAQDNQAFRQLMTSQLWPSATVAQMDSFNHLQRVSCSATTAARLLESIAATTVEGDLEQLRTPTLVLHGLHDARTPLEEGRLLAARIPGARLITFDSPNHTPLPGEPPYEPVQRAIIDFVSTHESHTARLQVVSSRPDSPGS